MKIVHLQLQIAFSDDEPFFEAAREFVNELVDGGMGLGRRRFRLNRIQFVAIGNQEIDLIKVMVFGIGFSVKGMVMGMMAAAVRIMALPRTSFRKARRMPRALEKPVLFSLACCIA